MGKKLPEIIGDIAYLFANLLIKRGYGQEAANDVAFEAADAVRKEFGGQIIYFPKGTKFELEGKADEIFNKFTGANQRELAAEYGVSVPHVYRVIAKVRITRRGSS